ncbi:MAG: S41 family peptidase [Longimicrobiales bacterium]
MTILCLTTGLVLATQSVSAPAPALVTTMTTARAPARAGYYRFPAIHNDVVVFVAEGDLWRSSASGGAANRLTTHLAEETNPSISPDGRTLAFTARYEGPAEVYTMPIEGGLPKQHTWEGIGATVVGWTSDGRILYTTRRYSTLPNAQLVAVDPRTNERKLIPLAQASDGSYDAAGVLYFTRLPWQGSYTKRYKGGTAQNIWRWGVAGVSGVTGVSGNGQVAGRDEAQPLTADYRGTSKNPMWWSGRVYFASDREGQRNCSTVAGKQECDWKAGIMNLWSMREDGTDVRQHTFHTDYDIQTPALQDGRVVYQQGADLWLLDIRGNAATTAKAATGSAPAPSPASAQPQRLNITLSTDFDHLRDRWVKRPVEWLSDFHISPTGDRVALIARGQLFIAPAGPSGRMIEYRGQSATRYREAHFMPDGKSLVVLSDQSGEVELWKLAANGLGEGEQLTKDAKILRWDAYPSPDGKSIAHYDKNQELFVYDVTNKRDRRIATNAYGGFRDIRWSPDGKFLTYSTVAPNQLLQVFAYELASNKTTALTSDRYDSHGATWSADGNWLFFLSDRTFNSSVFSPWGSRQPEPYYDDQTKIYGVQLRPGAKWPFAAKTELDADERAGARADSARAESQRPQASAAAPTTAPALEGALTRVFEVPVPAGNYGALSADGRRLYYVSRDERNTGGKTSIQSIEIASNAKPEEFAADVGGYELSADNTKVLFRKGNELYVVAAGAKAPANLAESRVNLDGWTFALERQDELQSLFVDAWRLERDYFYDPGMHGVDWKAMRTKYAPLAARVTDRSELNDVIAQMVGELSALHIFVRGGDQRAGQDTIIPASLGAVLEKDQARGGWRVAHIYRADPDIPDELSPLAKPDVAMADGDVIVAINGVSTLSVEHPGVLLNNRVGKQVLLTVRGAGAERQVIVVPISMGRENDLRYDEWEYTRRLLVDSISGGKVGYVHLRAMGAGNMSEFTREYYPVFDRGALIMDMRNNTGGNIDSWVLEKLMRKPWFYWAPRVGEPYWNMQFAFRGPMITVVNEFSASDGEAFPEGFRRLGMGKIVGTRTWGGEIWLSGNNFLADRGVATAAETGVYGPDGEWLIEGHGVDPDVVVDNLPRATFLGRDEQLLAAVRAMMVEIEKNPNPVPKPRGYRK